MWNSLVRGGLAALALSASSAFAQFGNPAFMPPGIAEERPGVPAPHQPNQTDRLFAVLIADGGLAEVTFAQEAIARGSLPAVREFAQRMVNDHTKANQQVQMLAKANSIILPGELGSDHKVVFGQLQQLSGSAFDLRFARSQVEDHQKALQLLEWEIDGGQDPDLRTFAISNLPIILDHLKAAQAMLAKVQLGER